MRRPLGTTSDRALGAVVFALGFAALVWGCSGGTPPPGARGAGAATTEGGPFAPNDVVAYAMKDAAGTSIGRVHSVFSTDENGFARVHTRLVFDPGRGTSRAGQGEVSVDMVTTLRGDSSPVTFKRLSSLDGRYELRFQDRAASVITGEGAREVPYKRSSALLLPRHDLMLLALAIHRAGLKPGSAAKLEILSPSTVSSETEPAQVYADPDGSMVVRLPEGVAKLSAAGRVTRFEEAGTGFVLELEDPPGEPPKIEPPTEPSRYVRPADADWSDRDVSIDVRDGRLSGTLSEPRLRADLDRAVAPGVVFLSDAGSQDRHGFGAGVDAGTWQILDRLVGAGFAVLRVDDRGVGRSTSRIAPEDVGLTVGVEDAAACVAFLRLQPGVDPERIFVIGHGQGGLVAILLATHADLSGVALLGTPLRTLPELIVAREVELTGAKREDVSREVRLAISALGGHAASRAQVPPQRIAELARDKQLLLDQANLDVPRALFAAKCEIGVFQGMKDFEVSWQEDAKPIVELLKKQKKTSKLFVYENVDHLMKEEPATSSLRRYADRSRRVDARVLDDLTHWLEERTKRRPK